MTVRVQSATGQGIGVALNATVTSAVVAALTGAAALGSGCSDATAPEGPPSVSIVEGPSSLRQGDVGVYRAEVRGTGGGASSEAELAWSVLPPQAGFVTAEGRLVGYEPGALQLVAAAAGSGGSGEGSPQADTVPVEILPRSGPSGSFSVVGHGSLASRYTSDLWVHGEVAYTGTWGTRQGPAGSQRGNRLYSWDVASPAAPRLADSVTADASTVNDVKVDPEGRLAVLTHEGSSDGRNGITLLDLTRPLQPDPIVRFTSGLEQGVHNVWLETGHVYVVGDGAQPDAGSGLHVLDISEPSSPEPVAHFYAGPPGVSGEFLHDVYVREGLAFLSHWNAGLVILDVGHGIAGGSPSNPVEVSRVMPRAAPGDDLPAHQVHNAWYWPEAGYVFVGEEDIATPGRLHVIDARDLRAPRHVASYRPMPHRDTPHNFWLDEERGILYAAWYSQGLRALDVSGELLGELERQDREVAAVLYDGSGGCPNRGSGTGTCTWAPQLHGELVYVADMNSGLWVLRSDF